MERPCWSPEATPLNSERRTSDKIYVGGGGDVTQLLPTIGGRRGYWFSSQRASGRIENRTLIGVLANLVGRPECVGLSFAYVGHFLFLRSLDSNPES